MPAWLSDLRRWLTTYKGVSPWPTTVDGWIEGARTRQVLQRNAAIEVANEIGAWDIAERMLAESVRMFPTDQYLAELNSRKRGAGEEARKRAGQRLRE